MTTDRIHFITSFFKYLNRAGNYIWLKAVVSRPEDTPAGSDIDLLIRKEAVPMAVQFAEQHVRVQKSQSRRIGTAMFLHLTFTDGSSLKIDLLTELVRKQWVYLDADYLFHNRIWQHGVAVCPPSILLEHVLHFNFLNYNGLPEKYVQFFGAIPDGEQQELLSFVNRKYGTTISSVREMSCYTAEVRKRLVGYLSTREENHLKKRVRRGMDYLLQVTARQKQTGPRIITFSGVDGAGKTTLLNDLKVVLTEKYSRKVVVLRHRPSLLPILSAWVYGKKGAEQRSTASLPHAGSNQSRTGSLLRFGYYYTDYLFGQFYIWLRYVLAGYTVVYDRYYFDFIIDAKRSNIVLGEWLPKVLYRFILKPGLNIFLYADPSVIRQRKQELSGAEIEQMTGRYKSLFSELAGTCNGRYLCVRNTDRATSLHTILEHYSKMY